MSEPEVKYGIFKTEIKNRFLCTVNVDGIDTLCYIPSSCRLSNFINMNGRGVLLLPIKEKECTDEIFRVCHSVSAGLCPSRFIKRQSGYQK